MSFSLSHIFEGNLEELQRSPPHIRGKMKWYFQLGLESGNVYIALFGVPLEGFVRSGVYWEISADVEGTIGTTKILNKKYVLHKNNKKETSHFGSYLIKRMQIFFLSDEEIVKDGKISVNLKILKFSTVGIRVFKQLDFFDSNLLNYDLALSIRERKLFCHSQILSLSSPVFAKILTKKKYSKEEPLQIELDSEMSVEDFKEFLHQLYFATEPIREDNWEILLHFAGKYEVAQILFCCEKFLLEKLLETDSFEMKLKAIEMIPLSCRYGMELLKSECFYHLFPLNNLSVIKRIVTNEHFVAMDEIRKLELVELIILY